MNAAAAACCHGGGWYAGGVLDRRRPRLGQIVEQDRELRCRSAFSARLIRSSNSEASIRPCAMCSCKKADRLVTVGIADSRFHGSPCRVGRLVSEAPAAGSGSGADGSVTTTSILGQPRQGSRSIGRAQRPLDSRRGTGAAVGRVVQKYGGSSVADAESIKRVAKRIVATKQLGPRRRRRDLGDG